MKKIYLDHSATTPVDRDVLEAMLPYFSGTYGNPTSIHNFGQASLKGVDKARLQTASYFNCQPDEIVFTSGATESDNLAVKGVISALCRQGLKHEEMHAITSIVEHDAVLEPFMELEKAGVAVTHLPVKANGTIDPETLKAALRPNTVLVSIMWVNSEVGAIMPIKEIGKIIKKAKEEQGEGLAE